MTLPAEAPVTIPGAIQFDLASRETGRTYRIFVYEPPVPPPEAGWPTVVLTDGNLSFPIASAVGGLLAFAGEPALIVGVGYPTRSPRELMRLRFRDLTPPTPLERIAGRPGLPPLDADDFGGAAAFRAFLLSELRPAIAAAFPVDAARTALYGHSLGGLFVLQALFAEPAAWRTYIASSPSVWWNERALLADEPAFAERLIETGARPRLLITIGADEQTPPVWPPPP